MINCIRLGEDVPTLLAKKQKVTITTFDDIAQKYFDSRELLTSTNRRSRGKYASQLKPFIGKIDLYTITKKDILNIQSKLFETKAPKTVNQYIQFIRTIYYYAMEEDLYTGTNPAKDIKDIQVDN